MKLNIANPKTGALPTERGGRRTLAERGASAGF
jgi:hypothetical protein